MRQRIADAWRKRMWGQEKKDANLENAITAVADAIVSGENENKEAAENRVVALKRIGATQKPEYLLSEKLEPYIQDFNPAINDFIAAKNTHKPTGEAVKRIEKAIRAGADAGKYEYLFDHIIGEVRDTSARERCAILFESKYPDYIAADRLGLTEGMGHPKVKEANTAVGPVSKDGTPTQQWVTQYAGVTATPGAPSSARKRVLDVAEGKNMGRKPKSLDVIEKEILKDLEQGVEKAWQRNNDKDIPALEPRIISVTTLSMKVGYVLKGIKLNEEAKDGGLSLHDNKIRWEKSRDGERTCNEAVKMLVEVGINEPKDHLTFIQAMVENHPALLSVMNSEDRNPNKVVLQGSAPLFISYPEANKRVFGENYLKDVFNPQRETANDLSEDLKTLLKTLNPKDMAQWFNENQERLSAWEEKLLGYARNDYKRYADYTPPAKASLERIEDRLETQFGWIFPDKELTYSQEPEVENPHDKGKDKVPNRPERPERLKGGVVPENERPQASVQQPADLPKWDNAPPLPQQPLPNAGRPLPTPPGGGQAPSSQPAVSWAAGTYRVGEGGVRKMPSRKAPPPPSSQPSSDDEGKEKQKGGFAALEKWKEIEAKNNPLTKG